MKKPQSFIVSAASRREFLARTGSGLGGLALTYLLDRDGHFIPSLSAAGSTNPLAPKPPHHQPKAKAVIWLFMEGGPSHVDLFDPKPLLSKLDGQPIPDSIGKPKQTASGTGNNTLMAPKRTWKQHGQSGLWVSDWYPHITEHVDDMA